MGLLLSVVIAYAGIHEAQECIKFIMNGMLPENEPDFQDLVEYYTRMLHKSANPSSANDWTKECGQGYLSLTEDENGKLSTAAIKYYGDQDSVPILFSTKISSFGQESVDSSASQTNGDYRSDRYTPTRTKTIITNTSESINVGPRNRSPTYENVSDPKACSEDSFEHDDADSVNTTDSKKLKWHYRPLSPAPQTLPEIQLQSEDGEQDQAYSDEHLRSLDGIKYRPLQRSDPSGRRRSYKKRHSSSSTSSRDSRASREEELKIFTSLEEAEFESMSKPEHLTTYGSSPNLQTRSHSRSRSRENSKERRNESWSVEGSIDSRGSVEVETELRPKLADLPKLGSFEEEKEEAKESEVTEEDLDDFWGSSD